MDIGEIKNIFRKKTESDNLTRQVKKRIKETTWEKQNQREGFTETFKPLISQFEDPGPEDKKTRNIFTQNRDMLQNQLALTQGLEANQQALNQGLQANRAAITQGFNNLGQIFNQLADQPEQFEDVREQPEIPDYPPPSYQQVQNQNQRQQYNIERNFNRDEPDFLSDFNRIGNERLLELLQQSTRAIRSLTSQINGRRNRSSPPSPGYLDTTARIETEKETMRKY